MQEVRSKKLWNHDWEFLKNDVELLDIPNQTFEAVTVPHTWNNLDGQDGGNNYYRGYCWYRKKFHLPKTITTDDKREYNSDLLLEEYYVEFEGVNSSCDVYLNNVKVARHDGGFSTFRIHLNPNLCPGENILLLRVDNTHNDRVYPQYADFTFFGGIYRDVSFIRVNKSHFNLDYHGALV